MRLFLRMNCILGLFFCHWLDLSQQQPQSLSSRKNWRDQIDLFANPNNKDINEITFNDEDNSILEKESQLRLLLSGQLGKELNELEMKRGQIQRRGDSLISVSSDSGKLYKTSPIRSLACGCEPTYELRDLGQIYYPRYVPSAVCSMETCWSSPYRCRPKFYKMHFLKRRDVASLTTRTNMDEIDNLHSPLPPETLRKDWTFEPLLVAVGCECSP